MCTLCGSKWPEVPDTGLSDPSYVLKSIGRDRRRLVHNGTTYKVSERTLRAEWRAIEARKQSEEPTLREALRRLFREQIQTLLRRLREKAGVKRIETARRKPEITPLVTSSLLNWNEWFERTGEVTREPLRQIIEAGYRSGNERLGISEVDFTSNTPFVRQTLNEITFQTQQVQNTFREMVAREVQRGLSEGEDIEEIIQRVEEKTEEQTGYRLRRTVRTASTGGFEAGQVEAYRDAGISEHRWLSQRDGRVRSPSKGDKWDHRTPDGQTVGVNEPFNIPGRGGISESLRFPGDPQGSAGNVINCRCSTRPVS